MILADYILLGQVDSLTLSSVSLWGRNVCGFIHKLVDKT